MFSEIVDRAMSRSGRPDLLTTIEDYCNDTVRECCALRHFAKSLIEDQVTVTTSPHILSKPVRLQKLAALQYADGLFPREIRMGSALKDRTYFFYDAGSYWACSGVTVGDVLNIGYYQFPKKLKYYESALRPAVFDEEAETWTYLTAVTDPDKLIAREKVTNWITSDWTLLITEGTLAKVFKLIKDQERAVTHYSAFERMKNLQFLSTELYAPIQG